MKVIDNLGQYSSPIDRVDRGNIEVLVDIWISKDLLHDVLAIPLVDFPSLIGNLRTWQSSNVPVTARLWTLASRIVTICDLWMGLIRPSGCRMNTETSFLFRRPMIAAEPVCSLC
jgi:hypothetical protein